MKRVLVLGSTGMAGHVISTYLEERGYDVYTTSRSASSSPKSRAIDVTDFQALEAWMKCLELDVIVNCIGILQKQADESPHLAILVNAYLPHWLEHTYQGTNTKIIHLSTDCVFSGRRGLYRETDEPDGPTMYDRSKALGEIHNSKDLTFRMSIIGPDRNEKGTGLFHWFMGQTGETNGYSEVYWNGVTTIHLAQAIDAAIQQGLTGLYQLTPKEPINKYDLLLLFQQVFGKTDVKIKPLSSVSLNKTLLNTRTDFAFQLKSYPEQVRDMKDWVDSHKDMYGKRYFPASPAVR